MTEPQLLQRSVSNHNPEDCNVNYRLLNGGTPDQVRQQFELWKYSAGQMISINDIPGDMDEGALNELFGEYGWIDTLAIDREARTAIIKFTNIHRWDFADEIADRHPEPYPMVVGTCVIYCGLHVPDSEMKDMSVSELAEIIKHMEQRFLETTGELTDRLMDTNHRLLCATQDFADEKAKMMMQITELTNKVNDITDAIIKYAADE
jgi:hypothetical protein